MAKSMTFNKRELEKKREKKRLDKLKRKEDRKANSGDGSLDSMIAYVDENGMITNTPPDPKNKQVIDASNISVSTPQREKEEKVPLRGRIEHFNHAKGYGFIKDIASTEKYFFHISSVLDEVGESQIVFFELEKGQKGMNAVRISLAN
jgi:cold shock CspA family protein